MPLTPSSVAYLDGPMGSQENLQVLWRHEQLEPGPVLNLLHGEASYLVINLG